MASPEAKQQRMDRAVRRLSIQADKYGTPKEVQQFQATINQPTMGDPDLRNIFIVEAMGDLVAHISGEDATEEELMADEKIYEAPAPGEDEPREWSPSHLSLANEGNQGEIPEDVAKAVNEGDAEGQVASQETQNLPEDENKETPKASTSDKEAKRGSKG